MMIVTKKFSFNSAHFLPSYVGKCKQLHGHTYMLEVSIQGEVNPDTGMVMDFHDITYVVNNKVVEVLDHRCLNDVISNPTAENVLLWIRDKLSLSFKGYYLRLRLWENPDSYVTLYYELEE
jgi:6-pyruvoyltetrahydropterin/6-carboxytetrahydropterin synthase